MTEISLVHMSVPTLDALLWEAQDGWRNRGVDHGGSEKIWENSHTFSLTSLKTFSSFNSPVCISPEIIHFDDSTGKKSIFFPRRSQQFGFVSRVLFCFLFSQHSKLHSKKNLIFFFGGGKLSNFIMVKLEVIWSSLSNAEQHLMFFCKKLFSWSSTNLFCFSFYLTALSPNKLICGLVKWLLSASIKPQASVRNEKQKDNCFISNRLTTYPFHFILKVSYLFTVLVENLAELTILVLFIVKAARASYFTFYVIL